jgi:WD40 repeat protein
LTYTPADKVQWSPDGTRILVAWMKTVVISALRGDVQPVADGRVVAEWAPSSEAVYYFTPGDSSTGQLRLGAFHMRRIPDGGAPAMLLDADAVASTGWGEGRGLRIGRMSLSPSGARMAVVAATSKDAHMIRIYDARAAMPLDLTHSVSTFHTPDLITHVEWSPDGAHLATIVVVPGAPPTVAVKLLELDTGRWTTLAPVKVPLQAPCIDFLHHKILSWSR